MFYAYLKIAVSLAVPLAVAIYAKQFRLDQDRRAIRWIVEHPPGLRWEIDHPVESLAWNRMQDKCLRRLIADLDAE